MFKEWRQKSALKAELRSELEDHGVLVFALARNNLETPKLMSADIEQKYIAKGLTNDEVKQVSSSIGPLESWLW